MAARQNVENVRGPRSDNKSGVLGVYWDKKSKRWIGKVGHNGVYHTAGYFSDLEEAAEAVRLLRLELFTHNDHDRITA